MPSRSYSDLAQYRLACQLWEKERQLWDERERTRVAALEEAISKGEAFGGVYAVCGFAIIGGAWYVGAHYGAGRLVEMGHDTPRCRRTHASGI
jgi:hypothetical protein